MKTTIITAIEKYGQSRCNYCSEYYSSNGVTCCCNGEEPADEEECEVSIFTFNLTNIESNEHYKIKFCIAGIVSWKDLQNFEITLQDHGLSNMSLSGDFGESANGFIDYEYGDKNMYFFATRE